MSVNLDKIPAEESSEVEFKAFSGGLSTKELATTLCAFANSDGGSVYIGVTDSRQIAGVSVTASFLDQVLNAAQEYCSPSIPIAISRIVVGNGNKEVLVLTTERSPRLHSLISGDTLIRIGTQDKRVIGDELLRLAETKSQVSYEEVELTAGLEALDAASVEEYYRARRRVSSVSSALSVGELLEKIGLATVKNERFQVKAGAFILFGKPNSDLLLQREFTFLRYDGSGTIFQFREDIRLPIPAQVERLLELIRPFNQTDTVIEGAARRTVELFPEEALREAILNAIAHRNYALSGLRNECRLYPDRIEFISPGGLCSMVSIETLGTAHYSRNPKITHALMILGLVEEVGQGITLMRESLKKNGNPKPEFLDDGNRFRVIFRAPRSTKTVRPSPRGTFKMASPSEDQRVTDLIRRVRRAFPRKGLSFTRGEIEYALGVKTTRAKMILRILVDAQLLVREGTGPGTRYRVVRGKE